MENPLIQLYPLPSKHIPFDFEKIRKLNEQDLGNDSKKDYDSITKVKPNRNFSQNSTDPANIYPLPDIETIRSKSQKFEKDSNQPKSSPPKNNEQNVEDRKANKEEETKKSNPNESKAPVDKEESNLNIKHNQEEKKKQDDKLNSSKDKDFKEEEAKKPNPNKDKALAYKEQLSSNIKLDEEEKINQNKNISIQMMKNKKTSKVSHENIRYYKVSEVDDLFNNSKNGAKFEKVYAQFNTKTCVQKLFCLKLNPVKIFRRLRGQKMNEDFNPLQNSEFIGNKQVNTIKSLSILDTYIMRIYQESVSFNIEFKFVSIAIDNAIKIFENQIFKYDREKDFKLLFYICIEELKILIQNDSENEQDQVII